MNDATTPPGRGATPPAGRYGRPPASGGRRLAARAGYGLALAVLAGVVVWIGWHQANPPVSSTVVRFQVIPDPGVEVTFVVSRKDGLETLCVVRARNRYGEETGRKEVVIPSGERQVTRTEVLRTKDTPVTGEVQGCHLTGSRS